MKTDSLFSSVPQDRKGEGASLGKLGALHNTLGQYEEAHTCLSEAVIISREIEARQNESANLISLGHTHAHLDQRKEALECYERSLAIGRQLGDKGMVAAALGSIARVQSDLRQPEKAVAVMTEAVEVSRQCGDENKLGTLLVNLGDFHGALLHEERAFECYQEALAISTRVSDRNTEARARAGMGLAYNSLAEAAAARSEREGASAPCEQSDLLERAFDQLTRACTLLDEAWVHLASDHDRISFGDSTGPTRSIGLLQRTLLRLERNAEALEVVEREHARSLELVLAKQRVDAHAHSSTDSGMFERSLKLEDMCALAARQKAALVVYKMFQLPDMNVVAWTVGSSGDLHSQRITIPEGDTTLASLIRLTREAIGARTACAARDLDSSAMDDSASDDAASPGGCRDDEAAMDAALRRCYELLIKPILPALTGENRLLIVPDRELYSLPFAALLDERGSRLIERYSLLIAPSAGTLVELEARREARPVLDQQSALVVGIRDFGEWAPALPAALDEAAVIAASLTARGTCQVRSLCGAHATKERVVQAMASSALVHLGTHGLPDGVLLSAPTSAQATLSMGEVQALELRTTRLVVLSCCDSFKGELRADGVVGISRAFLAAGALTVIASLWKVDDDATCELMARFYDRWLGEAAGDAALALQAAMVSMLRDRNPRFSSVLSWSAFVVCGLA